MTGVVAVVVLLALILAWFFWPIPSRGDARPTHRSEHPDLDRAELEAAERDVQDAADEESVRDWGPGAGKPPLA